jgi:hypothetical protein
LTNDRGDGTARRAEGGAVRSKSRRYQWVKKLRMLEEIVVAAKIIGAIQSAKPVYPGRTRIEGASAPSS